MTEAEVRIAWPDELEAPHQPDHIIRGVPVVPGVELLAWAAHEALTLRPGCEVRCMSAAKFERALRVAESADSQLVIRSLDGEKCLAQVQSRTKLARGIVRTQEHLRVELGRARPGSAAIPPDSGRAAAGPCSPRPPIPPVPDGSFSCELRVSARQVYESLVPFGPWFQNLSGDIELSPQGARANARTPSGARPDSILGSFFLLDAALHLGCVWGQRYAGCVAFPTGFERRTLLQPPSDEVTCFARPRFFSPAEVVLDVWLVDRCGRTCDVVEGLRMTAKHGTPAPDWIRAERSGWC